MSLSINSNMAATRASQYLAANHQNLQKSLDRLSSGKRITQASDDAGGLAVSMKLKHSINGLQGAAAGVANAISALQVQDGALKAAADIVSRIGELKSMYDDVTKNTSDKATYDSEFNGLQSQLTTMFTTTTFNGVDLFGGTGALDVNLDADGTSSLTLLDTDINTGHLADLADDGTIANLLAIPAPTATGAVTSGNPSDTLSQLAGYRAANGGQVQRLQFAQANLNNQITNMTAANGRIMDVDIATESAALARHQILVQASAAMVAQANSANNVALQLLQ